MARKHRRILGLLHRLFGSMIVQFTLVAAVFWFFHWICPYIHEHCKQNPKTPRGIGGQICESTAPLYSSPDVRIKIESDLVEAHATMGLARAKQGKIDDAVNEFQRAIELLKQRNLKRRLNTWLILPLIALAVYFITSRAIIKSEQAISLPVLLVAVIGLKMGIDLSVSLVNGGFSTLGIPISYSLEYYADVPKVEGIWSFLRDFNHLNLSLHSRTHPPGGALFSWAVAKLFNYDLITVSFAIIAFSTLTLIPIYLLAKQLYGEKIGRYSLMLCLVTPNMVLLSATCTDAVFTVFLVWSVYLYFRALSLRPILYGILTGVFLTISMLMNFTTTTLGIYFIILAIVKYLGNRVFPGSNTTPVHQGGREEGKGSVSSPSKNGISQHLKRHLTVLLISGGTVALLYLFLYLGTGYNVFVNLDVAINRDRSGMGTGHETMERYVFLSIANLFAFFIYVGVPTTALWLREVTKTIRETFRRNCSDGLAGFSLRHSFLIAYVIALIGIAFSTLFTLEVERIWMFMLPFILIPAGKHLAAYIQERKSLRMFYVTAVLLWIQILGFEILLNTRW